MTTGKGSPGPRSVDSAALVKLRSELASARGKQRLALLLEAPDPAAVVRALPPDEIYFLVRDLGLGDAASLVQLASPEQFRTFLDLETWHGNQVSPLRALPWLRAARAGALRSEREIERWRRKLAALDPELLSLVMLDTLRIHDLEEDPDPEIQSDRFMRTPEGKYLIEFTVDGTDYLAIRGLVDDLYAVDPLQATRTISAIRWEFRSELEESELRWRAGRLSDLGFPTTGEAQSWFSKPPAKPGLQAGAPLRPPGFFLAQFRRETLLDQAAELLVPEERERFEQELMAAANAVMVADSVDPGEIEGVRRAVESARAMLELGLEKLSGKERQRAVQVLSTSPLKRVFQEGFGRTLELAWRVERLLKAGGAGTRKTPLLDAPLGEALAALLRRRPSYFPGLEADRRDWGTAAAAAHQARPFLSEQDLERTARALDLAEALAGLTRRLDLAPSSTEGPLAPRLSTLYLTALANQRLGRPFRPSPIPSSELSAATAALRSLDDPRLVAEGEAGKLLAELAANRAVELTALRTGVMPAPGALTALLVGP
jgi:hypothetical protein